MFCSKLEKAINYLNNNIIMTIIIALQLGFLFILAYYPIDSYLNFSNVNSKVKEQLNNRNIYYIENNEEFNIKLYQKDNISDYSKFYDYLMNTYKVLNFTRNNIFIPSEDISNELNKHSLTNMNVENNKFSLFNGYYVNDNLMNEFHIGVCNGRRFEKSDFIPGDIKDDIPVILGNSFSYYYKLGDKIRYKDYNYNGIIRNLKVIGFLYKNQYIINKPIMITNVENLNYEILLPNKDINTNFINLNNKKELENININTYKNITESYLFLNDPDDINDIKSKAKEMNFFDINIVCSDDNINTIKSYFDVQHKKSISIFILVYISISIEMFINMVSSLEKRKGEFTVYYALGANKEYIKGLLIIEERIYFIAGLIVSSIFFAIFKKVGLLDTIRIQSLIVTVILFGIMIIINNKYLTKYLKKKYS